MKTLCSQPGLPFLPPSVVRPSVRRPAVTQAGECRGSEDWPRLAQRTALRSRRVARSSAGSRLAAVMKRSKTVIDSTVQGKRNASRSDSRRKIAEQHSEGCSSVIHSVTRIDRILKLGHKEQAE
ncbi:uncharacterized protein GJ701_004353 isoform 1-T1 [Geothlypis trichas]